ncbi:MAG TPA: winged helix DNA-binding protein [Sphingomonas sp.]|nr:winged helix DNA-binding protein [Sphingomonas sp.]
MVSVSSACVGACVAHTTALRCLKAMERKGVVSFRHDPFDKRRRFVSLTVETHRRIASWLAEV